MLERINQSNYATFDTLVQDYEHEFAPVTGKTKSQDGLYALDSSWRAPYQGYYWRIGNDFVGFVIMQLKDSLGDIAEFYVVPSSRRDRVGEAMAHAAFDIHRGRWQVRQIEGADKTTAFWRRVIVRYTSSKYTESVVDDPDWGMVTRQQFESRKVQLKK